MIGNRLQRTWRALVCRLTRCGRDSHADETVDKLRDINAHLDALIERRAGRDFLENVILAREGRGYDD